MSEKEKKSVTMQRFVVGHLECEDVLKKLSDKKELVVDFETYGLDWARDDDYFMVQICDGDASYLFNFKDYDGKCPQLDKATVEALLFKYIFTKDKLIIGSNIGFDIHMAERCGEINESRLWDLGTQEKILNNAHGYGKYSLSDMAERLGYAKDDKLKEFIEEHDLFEEVINPITGTKENKPRYDLVSWEVMENYALTDVEVSWVVYQDQVARFNKQEAEFPERPDMSPKQASENEIKVLPVLIAMEREGIRVDTKYCKEAYAIEKEKVHEIETSWEKDFGAAFTDSVDALGDILKLHGVTLGKTPDGNGSIAEWVLEEFDHIDVVKRILSHRKASKRATTYFANFLIYADRDGFIHPGFNPRGAEATGRMSGSRPNFQNVAKRETDELPIRKAIIPRSGNTFVQLDFIAQELRLLFDYAREYEMAELIKGGLDPHQKVADEVNVTRDAAKTLNFSIVYGIGKAKLAKKLGVTPDEAALFKARYLRKLPGVKDFIYKATNIAKTRKYVFTWDGARLLVPDESKAYQAPNKIIQGGSAVMTKVWLVKCAEILKGRKSRMIVPIHDSCLFDMHPEDFHLIPALIQAGRESYPAKILPQDMSCEYGYDNWHIMEKGLPT